MLTHALKAAQESTGLAVQLWQVLPFLTLSVPGSLPGLPTKLIFGALGWEEGTRLKLLSKRVSICCLQGQQGDF
jgi:hypothetical protein